MPVRPHPVEVDDLHRLKIVGRIAIAPTGAQIAFELKRSDAKENKNFVDLMLVDVATGESRALTSGDHNDLNPQWSPDGSQLAFISNREKAACLYVMPMTGGEPQRLTDRDGDVHDFAWSPDGKRLVLTYQAKNERDKRLRDDKRDEDAKLPQYKHITRLFHRLDGAGWWNGEYRHVYTVSATGGRMKQITDGDHDHDEPRFSPDGRYVSFLTSRLDQADYHIVENALFVAPARGGAVKQITQTRGGWEGHSWSVDSKHIALVGSVGTMRDFWKHRSHVWVVSASGGSPKNVTPRLDNDCVNSLIGDSVGSMFSAAPPIWSADGATLTFLVSENGQTHVYRCAASGGRVERLTEGAINVQQLQRTGDEGPLAVVIGDFLNPGDVYSLDADAKQAPHRLTQVNQPVLDGLALSPAEPFTVKSDGVEVHGWIVKPPGFRKNRKHPAILQVHGGPHAAYGAAFFHEFQLLASRGYVVFFSNPRGSSSYGLKFRNCIWADWGNLDWKDITKVSDYVFRQRFVDKKRVGITGGSYGGFMTNWAVGHTNRFRAAVTQRSVVNMETLCGASDGGWVLGAERGGFPWEKLQNYRKQSPLTYAKNIKTPLLIIHSEQDLRCSVVESEQLFMVLKVLEREVEMVRFEGESHGLSRGGRPQNRAERLRRIVAWFDKHMS